MEAANLILIPNLRAAENALQQANLINMAVPSVDNLTVDRTDITVDRTDITADKTSI